MHWLPAEAYKVVVHSGGGVDKGGVVECVRCGRLLADCLC